MAQDSVEISVCLAVWNTAHLLKRSVQTYLMQDLDPTRWELIVIDDNSLDDVEPVIELLRDRLNVHYVRLHHSFGMRGNTESFNTAFELAKGGVLAETTPECLLPRDAVRRLLEPHYDHPQAFVALKTYNLTQPVQARIDDADWGADILNIAQLPGWDDPWIHHNESVTHFGTHQICSIQKATWNGYTQGRGFPRYYDYGTDDPWYAGIRNQVYDLTLDNSCMAIHQWHPPFAYWQAKGYGPNLNRWSHTMRNLAHDPRVPEEGTCIIWDKGSHDPLTAEEIAHWKEWDEKAIQAGVPERLAHSHAPTRLDVQDGLLA